jgi:hypothetical protein
MSGFGQAIAHCTYHGKLIRKTLENPSKKNEEYLAALEPRKPIKAK